ncbi:hypothetical protein Pst134EA_000116 [Puccinia striiformis f. sp. tritici]|uniref:hypothetical protein n=1 Tax=Puccinia striiformis f. sp. tritici TaxID=168172 RepID=UPI002007CA72|nr:hypothetical protein Pst134EA_000116 [Puccinia striiformis f. sp. tritici]KAH9466254.1 hypothetical protein Pst134EB_001312 [Puccinia striiformis f. sp. tritici]KAH9473038.1 hypothetical protein Pst134EA_000116 [Puccinia striiformis f. sp. tritici]KAI9599880.1 hypothetical protein KEM48_000472 [Puccinia striiformis f. sp. tritici PST-130]KAI9601618.1 hypothetical protein H4Q26_001450 [Puccinia striiformis f. sp. tritici PST-130]
MKLANGRVWPSSEADVLSNWLLDENVGLRDCTRLSTHYLCPQITLRVSGSDSIRLPKLLAKDQDPLSAIQVGETGFYLPSNLGRDVSWSGY